jgi:hypothetical protein
MEARKSARGVCLVSFRNVFAGKGQNRVALSLEAEAELADDGWRAEL